MLDFLEQTFITFFNMTVTGSYIILAIILIRLLLNKAPKIFSYCLWLVAGLRLICPFSFSSVLSIFNFLSVPVQTSASSGATVNDYVPNDIGMMQTPQISTGINAADTVINPVLPAPEIGESVNPMQIIMAFASVLWIVGIVAMAVYGVVSLIKVYRRIEFATKLEGNVFECDKIRSPFVFGVFKPKIYLPCGMDEKQKEYVVLHEKNHIRRFDHITKLLSFAVLMLHWYNPLVWIGYNLMVRDMEMSCDERVLRELGEDEKKSYGLTLVAIGSNRRFAAAAPLSFSENVVEKRIVNVLKFKKPKTVAIILCVVLCIAVGAVCLTNSVSDFSEKEVQTKLESYFESQKAADEYEVNIAGVEIVEINKEENAVYGWQQLYTINTEYKNLINGSIIYDSDSIEAKAFRAQLDDNGDVIEISAYKNISDIPEFLGNIGEYDTVVFDRVEEKAKKEYEKLYKMIKVYPTENFTVTRTNSEINKIQVTGHELVSDHLGKIYLVLRLKSEGSVGDYFVDDCFELSKLPEGAAFEPLHPAKGEMLAVTSYQSGNREELWFGDFSMYTETVEETRYIAGIPVRCGYNVSDTLIVEFDVANANPPASGNPQLNYSTLDLGVYPPVTEKIKNAVSGAIYPGMNSNNEIVLSAKELDSIVKCYNKTQFTKVSDIRFNYEDWFYVSIMNSNGEERTFSIGPGGIIADSAGNCYECGNMELFKLAHDIADEHGVVAQPDRPTAEGGSIGYTEITTAPSLIMPNLMTTSASGYEAPSVSTTGVITEVNTPSEYIRHIVSDIETNLPDELELDLVGVDIQNSDYVYATFINRSDKILYIVPNQAMRKQVDGEWKRMTIEVDYEPLLDYYPIYPNTLSTVSFPFGPYFPGIEEHHGRYSLSTGYYYGTEEGADENSGGIMSFQFTVDVRKVSRAETGSKISSPDMVLSTPASTGVYNMKTCFSNEEIKKIVELYNGFDWSTPGSEFLVGDVQSDPNDVVYFSYGLTVIDGDREIFLIVDHRGIIEMNGKYYDVGSGGKQLYDMIAVPW